jgi:hypothetical protein
LFGKADVGSKEQSGSGVRIFYLGHALEGIQALMLHWMGQTLVLEKSLDTGKPYHQCGVPREGSLNCWMQQRTKHTLPGFPLAMYCDTWHG